MKTKKHQMFLAFVAGVETGRGYGEGEEGGGWGERVRDACYKNLHLFISAEAGVRKFLIG